MDESHVVGERHSELPAFLQPLLERMHSTGKVETVFGPSRQEHGRTIVPVARVAYGFGGGSGSAAGKKGKHDTTEPQPEEGTGGGGGINVTPIGVLEVTESGTRFVPLTTPKAVALTSLVVGLVLGILLSGPGRH